MIKREIYCNEYTSEEKTAILRKICSDSNQKVFDLQINNKKIPESTAKYWLRILVAEKNQKLAKDFLAWKFSKNLSGTARLEAFAALLLKEINANQHYVSGPKQGGPQIRVYNGTSNENDKIVQMQYKLDKVDDNQELIIGERTVLVDLQSRAGSFREQVLAFKKQLESRIEVHKKTIQDLDNLLDQI